MAAHGLNRAAASELGGGDVFHALPAERIADVRFLLRQISGGPPAVLGIRISESALSAMEKQGILVINQQTGAYEFSSFSALNHAATFFRSSNREPTTIPQATCRW